MSIAVLFQSTTRAQTLMYLYIATVTSGLALMANRCIISSVSGVAAGNRLNAMFYLLRVAPLSPHGSYFNDIKRSIRKFH